MFSHSDRVCLYVYVQFARRNINVERGKTMNETMRTSLRVNETQVYTLRIFTDFVTCREKI